MVYDKYYFVRIIIALPLLVYITNKIKNKGKTTGRMRLWAIFAMSLMLPVKISEGYMIFLNPPLLLGIIIVLYELFLKIYVVGRNRHYELETYEDLNTLKREIDFSYNPSIVGYLINQNLELKDLSADILNLYAKKIIDINKNEKYKYIIEYGKKYGEYKDSLSESDIYIIEKLLNNKSKFYFLEWKNKVKEKYNSLYFSETKKYMTDNKFYITNILIVLVGTIISKILFDSILSGIMFSSFIAIIFTFIYSALYQNTNNKDIKLSAKGKEEIKKCIKLKRFMEEYTLLEDRAVEEICIYESYIPYAVALNVNKKYFGTIFDVFGKEELKNIIEDIDVIEYYNG